MLENKMTNCFDPFTNEVSSLITPSWNDMQLSAFHPSDNFLPSDSCATIIFNGENGCLGKKAGRRTGEDTLTLSAFIRDQINKPPKKEYLRCQLIRGHKRMIRNLGRDIIPMKTLNKAKVCREIFDTYEKLKICYERNKEALDLACQTVQGPKTDGKAKREKMKEVYCDISKSYNNKYCKSYFESPEVQESYQLYIDYLFANASPSELSKKFKFSCCKSQKHEEECMKKWNMLRFYVSNKMIQDLGVRPWDHRNVTIICQGQEDIDLEMFKTCLYYMEHKEDCEIYRI